MLSICTIVATFDLRCNVDLDKLFSMLSDNIGKEILAITYSPLMYGSNVYLETYEVGNIKRKNPKKRNDKKNFRNQMLITLEDEKSLKVFKNGTVHFIGYKTVESIFETSMRLISLIRPFIQDSCYYVGNPSLSDICICAINAQYKMPKPISNSIAFQNAGIEIETKYNIPTYFTDNKLQVFPQLNKYADKPISMVCECPQNLTCCTPKRSGIGYGECVLCTLSIANTGKIRISGVQSMEQMVVVVDFIEKVIVKLF